jgi:hypothetical protein
MTAGAALATGALTVAALAVAALAQAPAIAQSASPGALDGVDGALDRVDGVDGLVGPVIEALGGATWQPLPAVAAHARSAVVEHTTNTLDAVAYGDPAMGCFVLVLRLGGGGGELLHHALREALAQQPTPWTVSDWTMSGDRAGDRTGVRSGFAFASETLKGQVYVMSVGQQQPTASAPAGHSILTACLYDAREPARSARLCRRLLPAIEDAMHTISEILP